VQYSVRLFNAFAEHELGITLKFRGEGDKEVGTASNVE